MSTISSIWAQDSNGVLGTGSDMCWRVPADFAHFKEATMGSPIIMGRLSFEALGRPLPGRTNIVLTRRDDYHPDGVLVAASIDQALQLANDSPQSDGYIWITGGAHIYAQTMDIVDELVITDLDFDARREGACAGHDDLVYAPDIDPELWRVDPNRSDDDWRDKSGDARWKCTTYVRRNTTADHAS